MKSVCAMKKQRAINHLTVGIVMPGETKKSVAVSSRLISCSNIKSIALVFMCFLLWIHPVAISAIEISDVPLETMVFSPPANLMMVLDNSGSMDWEFMTPEGEGLFQEQFYLFPENAYIPTHDHRYGGGHSLTPVQRRLWQSQWVGYNRIYFDPHKRYSPWPATQRHSFDPADLNRPWSNPMHTGEGGTRIDLTAVYFSVHSGGEVIRIANAHYFTIGDLNANGTYDLGEDIYLVTWVDENSDSILDVSGNANADQRRYYRFVDDGDDRVEDNELVPVTDAAEINILRPALVNTQGQFIRFQTDQEVLQNFANWCTYYRRRFLTLKAVVADTIAGLSYVNIGLCAVNGEPRMGPQPVGMSTGANTQDATPSLLNALYAMQNGGQTPLRSALDRVGRYFRQENSAGFDAPFNTAESGGHCQRHLALVVSDGFWNGNFSGLGNADGDNGAPYADSFADTLADVATYYYENDLRTDLEDVMSATGCADVFHQHMITMALSFGLSGTIDMTDMDGNGTADQPGYLDDPCFSSSQTAMPNWRQPVGLAGHEANGVSSAGASTGEMLDDLWHAAINGHGASYSTAQAPVLQRQILSGAYQVSGEATASALTFRYEPSTNRSILYRTSYDPSDWHGDLTAWELGDGADGTDSRLLWRASDQFQQPGLDWQDRCVVTYGGPSTQPQAIPFRYDAFSEAQQYALSSQFESRTDTVQMARDLVAYLRGEPHPIFRTRTSQLGDIVHCAPVVVGNTVFVGANDGMLHAFDAQSGQERFAYVPNLVFNHLKALSDPAFPGRHRFYVDGPLWGGEVVAGPYQRRTYLLGGLGKGGRGYFCLVVGSRHRTRSGDSYGDYQWDFHVDQLGALADEDQARQVVQWEYPRPDSASDSMDNNGNGVVDEPGEIDPHIGYSFGQGYAVNANNAGDIHRPVVIFGNGYASPNQSAVLYVLAADTGEIVRKIHTGQAVGNGLSTPALIDVNRDNRVDYAYAGDLQGNLWKFDLSADDPNHWGVAYGEDRNGDNVIDAASGDLPEPLFKSPGQPITGRPDIMAMANACNPRATGYMVIFGTGRYLAMGDHGDHSQQSIYGLWDYGDDSDDSEHLGFLLDRSNGDLSSGLRLVRQEVTDQTIVDSATTRQISQLRGNYRTVVDLTDANQNDDPLHHAGWFLDFPSAPDPLADPGERVTGRVTLRGGKAVVASLVPSQTPCRSGGSSWIYVLNGCDGSQPEERATNTFQGAKRYAGSLIAEPIIVKDPTHPHQDQILIPDPTGGIITEAIVGEFWGKAYWWQNID